MTKYIFHQAGNNERWDTIAYKYYGNCYKMQPIIEANPHIPIEGIIKEGTEVKVPVNEEIKKDKKELLPIWKRNSVE